MKNIFLVLILFWCIAGCKPPERDVSHCPELPTECDQYSCYFLGCDCVSSPGDIYADPTDSRFVTEQSVENVEQAKEVGFLFMELVGETQATISNIDDMGHHWYSISLTGVDNDEYEVITISPTGNVYIIRCGV